MEKKHIITITGDHASGQGTLSNNLNKELGYEIYRNGQYVRSLAAQKGVSIAEFQEYIDKHPELDRQIENSAKNYAANHDNLIIDAKLGFYAVPNSFKVYLKVDIDVAAKRALLDEKRKETENYTSVEDAKKQILYRFNEENKRWLDTYGVDRCDMNNYDIVIDTTNLSPEQVKNIVLEGYYKWLEE